MHYMTKEEVPITCENCLYWTKKYFYIGRCGNANHPHYRKGDKSNALTNRNQTCNDFWPKAEYRK